MNTFNVVTITGLLLGLPIGTANATDLTLSADAAVNQVGSDSDIQTTPGGTVSAFFEEPGGRARASAASDSAVRLQTFAISSDFEITQPASATAGLFTNYTVSGINDTTVLPLTFNFRLAGLLVAEPGEFLASVGFRYGINSQTTTIGGNANGAYQRAGSGINTAGSTSGFLGMDFQTGLGAPAPETVFDFNIPLLVESDVTGGFLDITLVSSAAAEGVGSVAMLDFSSGGLFLESATVPGEFSLDLSGVSVVFDSGQTVAVTRVGSVANGDDTDNDGGNGDGTGGDGDDDMGNGDGDTDSGNGDIVSVPEPTTVFGLLAVAMGVAVQKNKQRASRKSVR